MKCTKLSRDAADRAKQSPSAWICTRCNSFLAPDSPATTTTRRSISEKLQKSCKPSVKIVQWNADGLSTKVYELKNTLSEKDIDICMTQETKLRLGDTTPRIPGYAALRDDRKCLAGGGLLTYIKETLIYERAGYKTRDSTEAMSFRVKLSKNKWIQLTNVYAPPVSSYTSQSVKVATDIIPVTNDSLIVGDFNAHSPVWDNNLPADPRGEALEDWILSEDLSTLNTGVPTRVSRIEGHRDSAPDISICGKTYSKKCVWEPMDGIGSSDHIPICIKVATKVNHQSIRGSEAKWRVKNVDWAKFSEAVDKIQDTIRSETNEKTKIALFNGALISCANLHVGKVKRPKRPKPWMNPKVRTLVRKRNKLWRKRGLDKQNWRESWRHQKS